MNDLSKNERPLAANAHASQANRREKDPQPSWVLVQGFNLGYHKEETILFTIDP